MWGMYKCAKSIQKPLYNSFWDLNCTIKQSFKKYELSSTIKWLAWHFKEIFLKAIIKMIDIFYTGLAI